MPNGSAATTYTATAIPAATAASRDAPVRQEYHEPGDHHRGYGQRLDGHCSTSREPDPDRRAQPRFVAVAQRERDCEHRQHERRTVGVHRHGHPDDRAAGGDGLRPRATHSHTL